MEDLEKETYEALRSLKEEIDLLVKENKYLIIKNEKLQDEIDSLWSMMDELKESDIKNFDHLVKKLQNEVIEKSLMTTNKKADC